MKKKILVLAASIATVFCGSGLTTQAQQQSNGSQRGAIPAARGVSTAQGNIDSVAQSDADTHPLTGAELYTVGSAGKPHNIFDPSLFVIASGISTNDITNTRQLTSYDSVGGSLSLTRFWSHYTLNGSYTGVGDFYRGPNTLYGNANYQYHNLALSQTIHEGRWSVLMRDDFTYTPQSPFGGQTIGGPGLVGQVGSTGVLSGVNPNFSTNLTIQTGPAERITNTALGEIDYSVSRRTQLTFSGSYGVLHFIQSGFFNNHTCRDKSAITTHWTPKIPSDSPVRLTERATPRASRFRTPRATSHGEGRSQVAWRFRRPVAAASSNLKTSFPQSASAGSGTRRLRWDIPYAAIHIHYFTRALLARDQA